MARIFGYRLGIASAALAVCLAAIPAAAPAGLFVTIGPKHVVASEPIADCSSKAKAALTSILGSAYEAGDGTGEWLGYGNRDNSGKSSEAAAIHCYPMDTGYVVTITCAVEVPPNPVMAADLCSKLDTAFGAKTAALVTSNGI